MVGEIILVTVDGSKEVTDYALKWAVQNVIKPMDSLTLLAIVPSSLLSSHVAGKNPPRKFYELITGVLKIKCNHGDNVRDLKDINAENHAHDQLVKRTYHACLQMVRHLLKLHNILKVRTEVKVVADQTPEGSITKVALDLGATWLILDRCLKKEGQSSLKQLINCNLILVDREIQKVLRPVNLYKDEKLKDKGEFLNKPTVADMLDMFLTDSSIISSSRTFKANTSSSSSSSATNNNEEVLFKDDIFSTLGEKYFGHPVEAESTYRPSNRYSKSQTLSITVLRDLEAPSKLKSNILEEKSRSGINCNNGIRILQPTQLPSRMSLDSNLSMPKPPRTRQRNTRRQYNRTNEVVKIDRLSSIRKAMSVSIKQPPIPPPSCSVCKNSAPFFGRAPRKFTYKEIQEATDGFSKNNFLAKGGFGHVYKGILDDDLVVAVKQHKVLSAQGASEFCSEVEVLSCAQHKNLVILLLKSSGSGKVMAWHNRMKIAVGAARGLTYPHKYCRVGCIVHRDFRPNNILLTHDFEPMIYHYFFWMYVGDFRLARWQADGQSAEETRVVGAFGYLAPEYTQTGLITEKADVYAFGVVLLELLTGNKATEFSRNTKQPYLTDWNHQSLQMKALTEIVDPRLDHNFVEKEVDCMIQAASLCISPHPDQRPRMSEVLKILEGYMPRAVANSHLQPSSTFPIQRLNDDYTTGIPGDGIPLKNRLTDAPIHEKKKLNQLQQGLQKESRGQSQYKHIKSSGEIKAAGSANKTDTNTSKLPSNEEYQDYLQGSLSRYIQNMKIRQNI